MMVQKESEGKGTLRDIAYIIFKHKKNMIVVFCATVALTAVVSLVMTPVYRSEAKILVKFGKENVYTPSLPTASAAPPVVVPDPQREEHINSAIEMITGQKVVQSVIQKIGVNNIYPQLAADTSPSSKESALSAATSQFQKNLRVKAVKKSNIIDIKFDHNSPVIAAKAVNELMDTFVEDHWKVYRQPQNFSFFSEQVKLLSRKLNSSQAELEAFRSRNDISSLQEQKITLLKQIADVEVDLAKTRADISETRGKKEALEASRGSQTGQPRFGKETDYNPQAMATIRTKITELKLKEAELLNRYSESNTFVVNVRKEIEQAERLLAREEMIYHDKDARSLDQNMQALKQKEATLKETLAAFQGRLNSLSAVEMRFRELDRQFKLDEENYQLYVRKTEESRISNAMDREKIVNLSVVEPASVPAKPKEPNIPFNIGLSVLLGALLSFVAVMIAEYLGHTFSRADDLQKRLSVPVLATIREMEV